MNYTIRSSNTVRWFIAAAVAVAGVGLAARASEAQPESLFATVILSNPNCTGDSFGTYNTEAVGYDSANNVVCQVFESAGIVNASGFGATAQTTCSYVNGTDLPVKLQGSVVSVNSSGAVRNLQSCAIEPWPNGSSCSAPAATTSTCPAGSTVMAYTFGENY